MKHYRSIVVLLLLAFGIVYQSSFVSASEVQQSSTLEARVSELERLVKELSDRVKMLSDKSHEFRLTNCYN